MKYLLKSLIIISLFSVSPLSIAQTFPKNPQAGKCYQRCLELDKKIEWKEVDCKKTSKEKNNTKASIEKSVSFEKHKKKLIALGYNISMNSKLLDKNFINAHNKYISDQNRKNKKKKRLERRKKRRKKEISKI